MWPFSVNRDSPQAESLIGWWPVCGLDSVAGFFDLNPTDIQNNLVASGTVALNGEFDSGLGGNYNGSAYAVTAANPDYSPSATSTTPLTVSCWIQTSQAGAATETHFTAMTAGADGNTSDAGLLARATTFNAAFYTFAGGSHGVDSGVAVNDGLPHLLTGVYDPVASLNKIYVDGILQNTVTSSGRYNGYGTGGPNFQISHSGAGWMTAGNVDVRLTGDQWDIRVYNRSMRDSEIWEMYEPKTRWELYQQYFPAASVKQIYTVARRQFLSW